VWLSFQNILNVDTRVLKGIVPDRAPGLICPVDAPASARIQQCRGDVLVTVRGEHERRGAIVVAGVGVSALADQLLDLVGLSKQTEPVHGHRASCCGGGGGGGGAGVVMGIGLYVVA